ncbi:hypothetical protein F7F23_30140, partial [Escherichia coli]
TRRPAFCFRHPQRREYSGLRSTQRHRQNYQSAELLRLLRQRSLNRPGFPGECFICELRLPDHRF